MTTIDTGLHYPIDLDGLPKNWLCDYIGTFVELVQSGFACGAHNSQANGVPHVRPMNVDRAGRISLADLRYVPVDYDDRRLSTGDVLFNNTNSPELIGKTAYVGREGDGLAFSNHMTRLRMLAVVEPRFSALQLHYLWSMRYFLHRCVKHVNQASVSSTELAKSVPLVVPPLNEQKRIVAKIDELFSELDKGVDSLTTAREQLDVYRLAILHQALIDGNGAPFPTKSLDELIGEIGQGWSPKCDVNTPAKDGEWAIIKTTAVQPMSYLGHECKPLPSDLEPKTSIEIRDGDLLMTRKGPRPRTGVVCYVPKARPRSMLCDTVYRFRAREDVVLPEYLEIALNAPAVVQEINRRKSGISESGISLNHGKLRSLPIPVPKSLASQARIVQTVRERMSIVDHQCALVAEQVQRVEALRQAILKRAFSGQLVAQDPQDEPASILLERIRAEREESSPAKRRNNKNGKKEAA
jgi:type I restriction enzyme S subunit